MTFQFHRRSIKLLAVVMGLPVLLTGLGFAYQFNFGGLATHASYEERISFGTPQGAFG